MSNHSDAIGMVRAASASLAKTKNGAFYDPNGNIQEAKGMLDNALRLLETDQPAENDNQAQRTHRSTRLGIISRALLDAEAELEIAQLKRDSAWRQFMAMVDIVERTA